MSSTCGPASALSGKVLKIMTTAADPDARKMTLRDGMEVYIKDGKYFAQSPSGAFNEISASRVKGNLLGGPCGYPTCSCGAATYVYKFEQDKSYFVCKDCATELNGRAERIDKGREPPCTIDPIICGLGHILLD
jgi:hypothetical protein